jgi:glycosyltransferase involved in cell wall biosynthesis
VKVMIVHNANQQVGGDDVVVAHESKLLQSAGHQVVFFRRDNWAAKHYTGLRKFGLAKQAVWASDAKRELALLLRDEKPDVVHVHNTFVMISPSIYSACAEAGVPVVQTLHNYRLLCPAATLFRDGKVCEECMQHSLLRSIQHGCYREARSATAVTAAMLAFHRFRETWSREITCFVALSEFSRSKFIEGGLPAHKVVVKPNFIDPDPNNRVGDGDYALFAGRLSPEKGVDTLVSAWKQLHTDIPLVMVGGGPEEARLRERVAREGIKNVELKGKLSREQTLAALNNARFMVFPSVWYEGFPMALVEAFACSVPVICSRMGTMPEVVADGRTGLHFTPGDADDLARKVEWAWTHRDEVRTMGKEARHDFESKYTAEKNYPLLMGIYERAMEVPSRAWDLRAELTV